MPAFVYVWGSCCTAVQFPVEVVKDSLETLMRTDAMTPVTVVFDVALMIWKYDWPLLLLTTVRLPLVEALLVVRLTVKEREIEAPVDAATAGALEAMVSVWIAQAVCLATVRRVG